MTEDEREAVWERAMDRWWMAPILCGLVGYLVAGGQGAFIAGYFGGVLYWLIFIMPINGPRKDRAQRED